MFETRSHAWNEVGLLNQVSPRAAKRAAWEAALLGILFVAVVVVYDNRTSLLGLEGHGSSPEANTAGRIITVIVLLFLGWAIARTFGRALGPALFRRLDPATAGPVGFLIRLATLAITLLVALRVAGVDPRTLLVGGAFTAVILGLAAQQTLGNLFAGTVLLSARPFRVGDRVRLQGGPIAGQIEGTVSYAGSALHDVRDRRRLDHDPQQRRAEPRGAALARARGGGHARAPARRHDTGRAAGAARILAAHPPARATADHPGGARRRGGGGAHRRDPRQILRGPPACQRAARDRLRAGAHPGRQAARPGRRAQRFARPEVEPLTRDRAS